MTKRDAEDGEGITGAIKEGNYLEALDRTLNGMFQAAPSVVAALIPGGLGLTEPPNTPNLSLIHISEPTRPY